jgi:hypothetical protein
MRIGLIAVTLNQHKGSEPKAKEPSEKKMSNKEWSAPVFTKKENVTLAQHIENLDWYHKNGKHQSKTAKHFDAIYLNLRNMPGCVGCEQSAGRGTD